MNAPFTDDDLARAHEVFRRNHEAGRQRLLESLSQQLPAVLPTRRFTLGGRLGRIADWWAGSTSHVLTKLAVAAAVLAALTLGLYSWLGTHRAYALDDFPGRLLEVRSIYISGWLFGPSFVSGPNQPRPKYPLVSFAERPDRYWHTTYTFCGPDKTHKEPRVLPGYVAGNGRQQLSVNSQDKVAVVCDVPPIVSELRTEPMIQADISRQLMSGDLSDFVKTGSEVVNDTRCDVYERAEGREKSRVWLNPKTGLPIKTACYEVGKAGQETPRRIIDHVEVNVSANAKGLSFAPPEGYEVKRRAADEGPALIRCASGGNGPLRLAASYGLNIDDKGVLVCWSYYSVSSEEKATEEVQFVLGRNRPCDHVELVTLDVAGEPWKWSLVFPKKSGQRIGPDSLQVVLHTVKGGQLSLEQDPARFPPDRLASVIEEVQKVTNTIPAGSTPFTLDMLRARLSEGR